MTEHIRITGDHEPVVPDLDPGIQRILDGDLGQPFSGFSLGFDLRTYIAEHTRAVSESPLSIGSQVSAAIAYIYSKQPNEHHTRKSRVLAIMDQLAWACDVAEIEKFADLAKSVNSDLLNDPAILEVIPSRFSNSQRMDGLSRSIPWANREDKLYAQIIIGELCLSQGITDDKQENQLRRLDDLYGELMTMPVTGKMDEFKSRHPEWLEGYYSRKGELDDRSTNVFLSRANGPLDHEVVVLGSELKRRDEELRVREARLSEAKDTVQRKRRGEEVSADEYDEAIKWLRQCLEDALAHHEALDAKYRYKELSEEIDPVIQYCLPEVIPDKEMLQTILDKYPSLSGCKLNRLERMWMDRWLDWSMRELVSPEEREVAERLREIGIWRLDLESTKAYQISYGTNLDKLLRDIYRYFIVGPIGEIDEEDFDKVRGGELEEKMVFGTADWWEYDRLEDDGRTRSKRVYYERIVRGLATGERSLYLDFCRSHEFDGTAFEGSALNILVQKNNEGCLEYSLEMREGYSEDTSTFLQRFALFNGCDVKCSGESVDPSTENEYQYNNFDINTKPEVLNELLSIVANNNLPCEEERYTIGTNLDTIIKKTWVLPRITTRHKQLRGLLEKIVGDKVKFERYPSDQGVNARNEDDIENWTELRSMMTINQQGQPVDHNGKPLPENKSARYSLVEVVQGRFLLPKRVSPEAIGKLMRIAYYLSPLPDIK